MPTAVYIVPGWAYKAKNLAQTYSRDIFENLIVTQLEDLFPEFLVCCCHLVP
jgi:hypothetical protein